MKKLISRRKFLAAMGNDGCCRCADRLRRFFLWHCFLCCRFQYGCLCCGELG